MALDNYRTYVRDWVCVGPTFISDADNETVTIAHVPFNFRVYEVTFDTSAAFDGGTGIDLVDGGASGTGTGVIVSSTDALNGSEVKQVSYLLDDGDYINITVDNTTTGRDLSVTIWGMLYIPV